MGRTYYPQNDQAYDTWLAHFVEQIEINGGLVGLVPADLAALTAAQGDFANKYAEHVMERGIAKTKTSAKVTSRANSEALLRPLVQRIQKHPGMSDQLRSALGLVPLYLNEDPLPITELTPMVYLESKVGQVTVHWGPNPTKENQNGKPAGVRAATIYRRKAGETAFQVIGLATSSPYYDEISGEGSDYTYYVRYRGSKQTDISAPSPEATVAARGVLAA
jgi:hypothetical protein